MNFIQLCIDGEAFADEIDDVVDSWHDEKAGQGLELHQFLGMSWNEYSLWAVKPNILPFIINAHRKKMTIDQDADFEHIAMAARAGSAEDARKIEAWLKSINKI